MTPPALTPQQQRMLARPDGVVLDHRSAAHRIVVLKVGSQLRLHFVDPFESRLSIPANIMSRVDLLRPLTLLATYTQAMMLGLAWCGAPRRVFNLGLGGGRIPAIVYAHFPDAVIDSTETEPDLEPIVETLFGLTFDERQRLYVQDGRSFLERLPADVEYDLLLIDGFVGTGWLSGYETSTFEFFELCKRHLSASGVVSVNLLDSDPLYDEKVLTLRGCFRHTYQFVSYEANVFFGSEGDALSSAEIEERAVQLQGRHHFAFPFVRHAAAIRLLPPVLPDVDGVLRDGRVPQKLVTAISPDDPLFYNVSPQSLCPCGSGRSYSDCHARPDR